MKRGGVVVALVLMFAAVLPASADYVYPIVFPVDGENRYTDDYGAPRSGHTHIGIDIMAAKMTPVLAAASGTVGWVSSSCCAMQLIHDDGYESWYIHLNNDTPGTDDGQGWGFAPGIKRGVHVSAGQLIGWVGDSGNAESTGPHLHFELHYPGGEPFNPYASLLAAEFAGAQDGDEIFFYRGDGLFRFYDINSDATIGSPLVGGDDYTTDWTTITAIDLEGDGLDEMFFYRTDGLYRYYDVQADGTLPAPMLEGNNYTTGWNSITAIDLEGDGQDEMFFYRTDGLYRYYNVRSDGSLPKPLLAGDGYTTDWDVITAIDLDGDGQDEIFFYRSDGLYRYYDIQPDGSLPSPLQAGSDYPVGWDVVSAIDLDGDGEDEIFFYRSDGLFKYYPVGSDGTLGSPILEGSGYTSGWDSITAINLHD